MRTISRQSVVDAVAAMCIDANRYLPADVLASFAKAKAAETVPSAREIFGQLEENAALAARTGLPLCQDCGLGVFFVEAGEDVRLEDGSLREAINAGMVKGYGDGFLRKSTCDPFTRKNVGDNSPAIIHFDMVPGDALKICMMAKGGGSENMSRVMMLAPAQGLPGIREFVIRRVAESGSNPCPPILVGVGIGGNFELAAINSKKALMRRVDDVHPDPEVAAMEADLLASINRLGIGPMGLGGATTCLGVKIRTAPCHLASLPLAVNIQCHSSRHKEVTL
ncbi:hydro-lyase, Fe-S type, tartrate/fumarate subfamily, alpha subunit [Solidesulfovibrio fructosivorans JJ]]|uniref:Hydro-lyase, Fe-S type, tartrate/fumarate subfamily, alpha subunit n=1 Tax=Solidesulfovibrio fructosivorans JJ] TaxID=596151 RepID=E1JUU8_SOLFR|nr:fumarate hydratase [Solidesulfovibrio fructosivorans]EFL51862.1 hydro-lyase, Fe-S type, tartrate/fumarate subfamily, alpha subunit [Solidesulfovibrio fructosivorans JJ]]